MAEIGRLLTAMVTPFDGNGHIDYAQARRLGTALLDAGSDGLVIAGTTGESPTLTLEEKLKLFSEMKAVTDGRGSLVANTGTYSTSASIEISNEAERIGVDGILLVTPYYNKPPQEGLYRHFKEIAANVHIPCILYNVPGRTGVNLDPETTIKLSRVENIVGIKEASGNLEQVSSVLEGISEGFAVWSGNDDETFQIMTKGGYGAISVVSHLIGDQLKAMMELILRGDIDTAEAEHNRLQDIFKGLFVLANPIPIKYALNKIGLSVGNPRLPLIPPDDESAARIDEYLKPYKIDLLTALS